MDNPRHDRLTVVVAACNEAEALPLLHPRIRAALAGIAGLQAGVLYVDDGSRDDTWRVLQDLAASDPQVALLRLSRNFGKEAALTAGLDRVGQGAAMILDADGQDPPELIPEFVARWREGWDDVYGTRIEREGDGWVRRGAAAVFYRLIGRLSPTPVPADIICTSPWRIMLPLPMLSLCAKSPSSGMEIISISRCGWVPKPCPPATWSSLITRNTPKFMRLRS